MRLTLGHVLPEAFSSEHICSASSLTPIDTSPILSSFQPRRRSRLTRIFTTEERTSWRNCREEKRGQVRESGEDDKDKQI